MTHDLTARLRAQQDETTQAQILVTAAMELRGRLLVAEAAGPELEQWQLQSNAVYAEVQIEATKVASLAW